MSLTRGHAGCSPFCAPGQGTMGGQVARLLWNREETKAHLARRHHKAEADCLRLLGCQGSMACMIYTRLGPERASNKQVLNSLRNNRRALATLGSVLRATLFRSFGAEGVLRQTVCPLCRGMDTFDHVLLCAVTPSTSQNDVPGAGLLPSPTLRSFRGEPWAPTPILPPSGARSQFGWVRLIGGSSRFSTPRGMKPRNWQPVPWKDHRGYHCPRMHGSWSEGVEFLPFFSGGFLTSALRGPGDNYFFFCLSLPPLFFLPFALLPLLAHKNVATP